MEVKAVRPVSLNEAKEILAERKNDGELGYEQAQALENAERFAKFTPQKAKELMESLPAKISKELAVKIIDICPDNPATLRAIAAKEKLELSEEEINQILKELA